MKKYLNQRTKLLGNLCTKTIQPSEIDSGRLVFAYVCVCVFNVCEYLDVTPLSRNHSLLRRTVFLRSWNNSWQANTALL